MQHHPIHTRVVPFVITLSIPVLGVQNSNDHNAHIGKNRDPHIYDTHRAQRKAGKFNDQCKCNILLYNANALSGNLYGILPSMYRKKLQNVHNSTIQCP